MPAINMEFDLVNRLEALDRLNLKLDKFRSRAGFETKCFAEISLALEEMFTNIVRHGHTDGSTHTISFNLSYKNDTLTVSITDDGVAFDPNTAPAPDVKCALEQRKIGGLGVYLVKKVMDEIRYMRCDNQNITVLKKFVGDPPCSNRSGVRKN